MFERFTDKGRKIIILAREEAECRSLFDESSGIQHRPVSAQHEDHIAEDRELGCLIGGWFADQRSSLTVQHDFFPTLAQPRDQIFENVLDVRKLRFGQDPNGFHAPPVPMGRSRREWSDGMGRWRGLYRGGRFIVNERGLMDRDGSHVSVVYDEAQFRLLKCLKALTARGATE